MDNQRSKKHRSVGASPASSRYSTTVSSNTRRPDHSDKHRSVPVVAPRRPSETSHASEEPKAPDSSRRTSKGSSRDDAAARSSVNAGHPQIVEQRNSAALSVKSNVQLGDGDEIPVLTFAVIGNSSVGKSVFIRNALDLRRLSTTQAARSKVRLGGSLYRLQLVEVPLDSVDLSGETILWSSIPELKETPDVDGVLCLYDVSEKDSLEDIPQLLISLEQMDITTCLVSCKVDIPPGDREIGPKFIDQVSTRFPKIAFEEARIDTPDTAKRCLLKILNETLAATRKESHLPQRARSKSNDPSPYPPRRSSKSTSTQNQSKPGNSTIRSRSRENSLDLANPPAAESGDDEESNEDSEDEKTLHDRTPSTMPIRVSTTGFRPRTHIKSPQTPMSSTENVSTRAQFPSERASRVVPQTPESFADATTLRRGSADTAESRTGKTFLDIDDESPVDDQSPVGAGFTDPPNFSATGDVPHQGVSFAKLVDRLLTKPVSKADHKFIASFLCLYRLFATPLSLLMSIIDRFVETEESDVIAFAKASELLRYLAVLGLWTAQYPGDFADPAVRDTISTFVSNMEKNKSFAPAARQVANNLQTYVLDEDEDWTFVEEGKPSNSGRNTMSGSSQYKRDSARATRNSQRSTMNSTNAADSDFDDSFVTPSTTRHSAATSSASSLQKSSQGSNHASDSLHQLNIARENARKLRIVPQKLITKLEWHSLLAFTVEELAVEITRMDWTMYAAIRPRDFVRYVTVSSSQRSRQGRVDYIGMMTKHFNHLALFVSGMILLRDKPKHRARVLEKFMDLAWKVRQMNNYHALGAIVAALSGEAIVRLSQTHELVPQEKHKQFLRLKILMGHQKSHAAYRMAWENSSAERIPYLPRIQEDLTKAAQGNPTFVDSNGNINWKKFEIMGDTIVSIQRSQEHQYTFPDRTVRGHDIDGLILETKILEGEDGFDPQQELYERSKLIEPPASGGTGTEKKKFDWLRR